ncbi:MAG TPA: DUF2336 domain-containing protein [Roseiarcus sp.]
MREIEAIADRQPAEPADRHGIVRRFLAWTQRADAECRADAASALARAYLYSDLTAEARAEAALGLTALLDDPSAMVRRALAEALASAAEAPRHIVLALACDQSEVASVILCRSPALADAELVDCAAMGDAIAQAAIAARPRLGAGVAAALAEIGARDAVLALVDNLEAALSAGSLWRIFERFGEDAELREALLARAWLPPALRNELAATTARTLAKFVARCGWLSEPRAERIARETREQVTVEIARGIESGDLDDLVRRMRTSGALTVAVLMRSVLCGERDLFVQAMVELTDMPRPRVAAFARSPASHGFAALYAKAGLPLAFLPAFRAALDFAGPGAGETLSLALAERAMQACGADPAAAPLRALLARLAVEAARQSARSFAEKAALIESTKPLAITGPSDYAPLLIDAVAAALEDCVAPPVETPLQTAERGDDCAPLLIDAATAALDDCAPAVEPFGWLTLTEDLAPPVQLPADMLAALAEAA